MNVRCAIFVFLIFAADVLAKECSVKKSNSKLLCYYSKAKDINSCKCTHVILPANSDVKSIDSLRVKLSGVKILLSVHDFNEGLVNVLKDSKVDGLEINLRKLDAKNDISDFITTVRSKLGADLYIALSIPSKAELLAKYYDFKGLSKNTDLFVLQTALLGTSKNVTFHPSRLSGLWDMQNADSVVDLVTGLGAPLSKLVITAPVQAFKFTLQNEEHTAPGSPALDVTTLTREELCRKMSASDWTLERDQDKAGPYIFRKNEWIAFDDPTSMDIKAKYSRVRGLAGLALKDVSQDGGSKCGGSLLDAAHNGLSKQARAPRGAVLHSLEREILESPGRHFDNVQVSPYRISRIIDVEGKIHIVRQDTRTEFACSRQGYFVHPRSCGRFYRCVKFDQLTDEFNVFEFDCPAGLAFDERVEVCVWPGSLPHASACSGSSEIAPVPKERFECSSEPGYFADPENCRWFFACIDHGKSPMTAYEFRCPFGLVFDQERLLCEWPWLVPKCSSGLASGVVLGIHQPSVEVFGGKGLAATDGFALGHYDGLGPLGVVALGGVNGPLEQPVAKIYSSFGGYGGHRTTDFNTNRGFGNAGHSSNQVLLTGGQGYQAADAHGLAIGTGNNVQVLSGNIGHGLAAANGNDVYISSAGNVGHGLAVANGNNAYISSAGNVGHGLAVANGNNAYISSPGNVGHGLAVANGNNAYISSSGSVRHGLAVANENNAYIASTGNVRHEASLTSLENAGRVGGHVLLVNADQGASLASSENSGHTAHSSLNAATGAYSSLQNAAQRGSIKFQGRAGYGDASYTSSSNSGENIDKTEAINSGHRGFIKYNGNVGLATGHAQAGYFGNLGSATVGLDNQKTTSYHGNYDASGKLIRGGGYNYQSGLEGVTVGLDNQKTTSYHGNYDASGKLIRGGGYNYQSGLEGGDYGATDQLIRTGGYNYDASGKLIRGGGFNYQSRIQGGNYDASGKLFRGGGYNYDASGKLIRGGGFNYQTGTQASNYDAAGKLIDGGDYNYQTGIQGGGYTSYVDANQLNSKLSSGSTLTKITKEGATEGLGNAHSSQSTVVYHGNNVGYDTSKTTGSYILDNGAKSSVAYTGSGFVSSSLNLPASQQTIIHEGPELKSSSHVLVDGVTASHDTSAFLNNQASVEIHGDSGSITSGGLQGVDIIGTNGNAHQAEFVANDILLAGNRGSSSHGTTVEYHGNSGYDTSSQVKSFGENAAGYHRSDANLLIGGVSTDFVKQSNLQTAQNYQVGLEANAERDSSSGSAVLLSGNAEANTHQLIQDSAFEGKYGQSTSSQYLDTSQENNHGVAGNINIVGGGFSAVGHGGLYKSGVELTQHGVNVDAAELVTVAPISVTPVSVTTSPIPVITSVPVPSIKSSNQFSIFKGGVVANTPELQYKVESPGVINNVFGDNFKYSQNYVHSSQSSGFANATASLVNHVSVSPTVAVTEGYSYSKPSVAFVDGLLDTKIVKSSAATVQNIRNERPALSYVHQNIEHVQPVINAVHTVTPAAVEKSFVSAGYQYPKPTIAIDEKPLVFSSVASKPAVISQPVIVQPVVTKTVTPVVITSYEQQNQNTYRGSHDYNTQSIVTQPAQPAIISSYSFDAQKDRAQDYSYSNQNAHSYIKQAADVSLQSLPADVSSLNYNYGDQNTHAKNYEYKQQSYVNTQPIQPVISYPVQAENDNYDYNEQKDTYRPAVVTSYSFSNQGATKANFDKQSVVKTSHLQQPVIASTYAYGNTNADGKNYDFKQQSVEISPSVQPVVLTSHDHQSSTGFDFNKEFQIHQQAQPVISSHIYQQHHENANEESNEYNQQSIAFGEKIRTAIGEGDHYNYKKPTVSFDTKIASPATAFSYQTYNHNSENNGYSKLSFGEKTQHVENLHGTVVQPIQTIVQPIEPVVQQVQPTIFTSGGHGEVNFEDKQYDLKNTFVQQPAVVSNYHYQKPTQQKTDIVGYEYPKPSVQFTEEPSLPSYANVEPVKEEPFIAKAAYVTGSKETDFGDLQVGNKVESYVSSTPAYQDTYFSTPKKTVHVENYVSPTYTPTYSAGIPVYFTPSTPRPTYPSVSPVIAAKAQPTFSTPRKVYFSTPKQSVIENYVSSTYKPTYTTPLEVSYVSSTPRPTYPSTISSVITAKVQPVTSQPHQFYSYDSRLVSVQQPIKSTVAPIISSSLVTQSRPISRYSFSSLDDKYNNYISTAAPKIYIDDVSSTPRSTYSPALTEDYNVVKLTKPVGTYLPIKTTNYVENYEGGDYVVTKSRRPSKVVKIVRPKSKAIVKVNDFHPMLAAKLGAQCTCVSNTLTLRKTTPTRINGDYYDNDDDVYVIKSNESGPSYNIIASTSELPEVEDENIEGVVINDYEPQKVVEITPTPEISISTSDAPVSRTPLVVNKRIRGRPYASTVVYSESPVTKATDIFYKSTPVVKIIDSSNEEKVQAVVRNGLSLVKSAIREGVKEALDGHQFDRYGPGGLRSRDETLQGTIDCQRAGLFRHPTHCNKFYACRWDCDKNRFTLHIFNCPVHLTFDNNMGACNWPSQGPACLGNTLLPID